MKLLRFTPLIIISALSSLATAQEKPLKKSWIKLSIEELGRKSEEPDTAYLRYVFNNSTILYGFEPGFHSMEMPYSRKGKKLTLGFDQWTIETLTDSTLTIFLPGFRRMKFLAEDYLQTNGKYLEQIGEHKRKPLYKTNRIITPRYKKPNRLDTDISQQDRSGDYNIRKAGIFRMSFIVTDEGEVEKPEIIKGVAPGYDDGIIKELLKTSKRWTPAMFRGKPIQTLMFFEIKFLDSFTDHP